MKMQGEPSLEQIDDYDNNESPQKRRTVRFIVMGLIVVGITYAFIKFNYSIPSDYIGTPENPGIDTSKR